MGIDKTSALLQWLEHLKPVFLIYWKHFEEWKDVSNLLGIFSTKKYQFGLENTQIFINSLFYNIAYKYHNLISVKGILF